MRRTIRRHIFGRASAKHESKTTDSSVSRAGGRGPVLGGRQLARPCFGHSDKAEIVALNRRIADAIGRGDLDIVIACYG